jgi:isopentenyldiphosphate isomerase
MVVVSSAAQEPVEVVDEDDRVLGVVPRARMRRENLRHRAVFVAVYATDGRLLVHRRAET